MQRRRVTAAQTIATGRGSEVSPYGIKRKWIDFRSEKRNNQNTKSSTSVNKRKSKRKTMEEAKRGRWTSTETCGNTRSPQQTEAEGSFLLRRLVLDCWKQACKDIDAVLTRAGGPLSAVKISRSDGYQSVESFFLIKRNVIPRCVGRRSPFQPHDSCAYTLRVRHARVQHIQGSETGNGTQSARLARWLAYPRAHRSDPRDIAAFTWTAYRKWVSAGLTRKKALL